MSINHNYSDDFRFMRESELQVNFWIQQNVQYMEPLLEYLSLHINVSFLMDYLLPMVAVINYRLMVLLASALSVSNVFTSTIKWVVHSTRPYWYARQMESTYFNSHELVCETTSGFPSSHITSLTTLLCISTTWRHNNLSIFITLFMFVSNVLMCISRIYFGGQFLHQCFISVVGTIMLLHYCNSHACSSLKRGYSIVLVVALGFACVLAYIFMLNSDIDPFWSVRMGFKYCPDPAYLKHNTSPVFVLARDLGFLMGVALSAPIRLRYTSKPTGKKRVLLLIFLEGLNYLARHFRPTQSGRFLFVAAEFMRNVMHAYCLLYII